MGGERAATVLGSLGNQQFLTPPLQASMEGERTPKQPQEHESPLTHTSEPRLYWYLSHGVLKLKVDLFAFIFYIS